MKDISLPVPEVSEEGINVLHLPCLVKGISLACKCRALGDANFKEGEGVAFVSNRPDVRHLLLTEADAAVVIASDGLTDVMSDQDAADIILSTIQGQVPLCPLQITAVIFP